MLERLAVFWAPIFGLFDIVYPVHLSSVDSEVRSSAVLVSRGATEKDEELQLMILEVFENSSTNSMSGRQIRTALLEMGRECSPSHIERTGLKPMISQGYISVEGKARATRYSLIPGWEILTGILR